MLGEHLRPSDRILILGAGGWLGQTLLNDLPDDVVALCIGSESRNNIFTFDAARIHDFAPTIVFNFAFLTRERVEMEGVEHFTAVNSKLTRQFVQSAELNSVRAVLTISSGAAITEPKSPYGSLKLNEELAALSLESAGRSVVVGRAYSLSGPFVRRPHAYAFSDFVMQADKGQVVIKSDRPTFRRYVAVSDFLAVCLRAALKGESGIIESGGKLVEMGELAEVIVERVRPGTVIKRVKQTSADPSTYAADDFSWSEAIMKYDYNPLTLEEQVDATAKGLLKNHG